MVSKCVQTHSFQESCPADGSRRLPETHLSKPTGRSKKRNRGGDGEGEQTPLK